MRNVLKWMLASTLIIAAVSLGVWRFSNIEWSRVDYDSLLRPITYNANEADSSPQGAIVLTGAAKVRRSVRNAAVEVATSFGRGSGTLFEIEGYYLVFTAAHIVDNAPVVTVIGRNGEMVFGTPVLAATQVDMAVVLVPRMNSRTPMKYKPARQQDINEYVGEDVTYTGFPSHHDLITIDGVIASEEDGNLVMHSYAWPGASGAGVFDFSGNFIGVVRAVDLGVWAYQLPPQLVEDMVWIAPSWGISKKDIETQLKRRGSG